MASKSILLATRTILRLGAAAAALMANAPTAATPVGHAGVSGLTHGLGMGNDAVRPGSTLALAAYDPDDQGDDIDDDPGDDTDGDGGDDDGEDGDNDQGEDEPDIA